MVLGVRRAFAVQEWGPEFKFPAPNLGMAGHTLITPVLWGLGQEMAGAR